MNIRLHQGQQASWWRDYKEGLFEQPSSADEHETGMHAYGVLFQQVAMILSSNIGGIGRRPREGCLLFAPVHDHPLQELLS